MTDDKLVTQRHSAVAFVLATLVLLVCGGQAALGRVIQVGPDGTVRLPSQAAAMARDGDRVIIESGTYHDCAIWRANRLTIEGRGPNAILADKVCIERGIFILFGQDTTIRNLTFSGSRGHYHNSAGILGEGANLTVENSRFLNNENGILVGGGPTSHVRIVHSVFIGNGSCEGSCAHGVYAGSPIAQLDVEFCRFLDTRTAHHVKSRARETIVANNDIADGESGTSSYLIDIPNGGDVLIRDNVLQKGIHSSNLATAIAIGEEGVKNPTHRLIVRDNRFTSMLPDPTVFVRNTTKTPATLTGNRLGGAIVPLDGPGTVKP